MKRRHLGDFFNNRQEPGRPGLPVMAVTMNDSLVLRDDMERRTESALAPEQHLLVRKGDIAYNMMRMWQGACGLAETDCIVSPAYVVLEPKPGIDPRFAYQWFKSSRMIYLFWAYSHGLTEDRLRLYFDAFAEIPAAPPPLDEQRRIATLLETWDRAIAETESLIAAKRRRLALARKVLFSDLPATCVSLAEFAEVCTGVPAPQEKGAFASVGRRFLRVSDLAGLSSDGTSEPEHLSEHTLPTARLFPMGTIVFAKSGMSAHLGRIARLPTAAVLVSHLGAVVARDRSYEAFLFHWLVEHPPSSLLQGDAFPSIRISEVAELPIPAIAETQAIEIGGALEKINSDLDSEIRRASALKVQKLALMRRLLAGQLRPETLPASPMTAKRRRVPGGAR